MKPEEKRYILENIDRKSIRELSQELNIKERKIRKFLEKEKEKEARLDAKAEAEPRIKKGVIFASILLIIILGFIAYSNSLKGEFIWDDTLLVSNNVYIKDWSNLKKVFTQSISTGAGVKSFSYRPIQMITYMIDYSLWKLDVRGYHLTNILLHLLAVLSIYWLVTVLFDDWLLSLFTGILFVVHPVHTEAVSYIAGRADPLVAVLILLCFIFYVKYLRSKNIGVYLLMLLSYISAVLSRESSLILPVLLFLYHYTFKKKFKLEGFLPILAIAFIYVWLRLAVLKTQLPHLLIATNLFQRIPGFFVAITNYTKMLFLPFGLHMEYGNILFKFTNPKAIFGVVILISLLICAFRKRESDRFIFFSILWFFIALLPLSNLYPASAYMAEHWLYLPSMGFFLILAKGLRYISSRTKTLKVFTAIFIIGLLSFYSYLTVKQNNYWRESIAFYKRILEYAPDSPRVHNDLGVTYYNAKRYEEAIEPFKKAIELDPNYPNPCYNLGTLYSTIGRKEEAIGLLKRAIELKPDYADAYNTLGNIYSSMGNHREVIALYEKAIESKVDFAPAYNNLGNAYKQIGNYERAIALYKEALSIDPNCADIYFNLGLAYRDMGKRKEAMAAYKKAIEINPNYAAAHNNLAADYYCEGQHDLAIKHCDRAVELGYKVDPQLLEYLRSRRR